MNLIHCTLSIKGSRKDLEAFRRKVGGCDPSGIEGVGSYSDFSLNSLIPVPDDFYKSYSMALIDKLREELWGCASDAMAVKLKESRFELKYTFVVAKNLPIRVLSKMASEAKGLKVKLNFVDPRTGIKGFGLIKDDKFILTERELYD